MGDYPRNEFVQLPFYNPLTRAGEREVLLPLGRLGPRGQCPEFREEQLLKILALGHGSSSNDRFACSGQARLKTFLSGRHPRVGMSLLYSKIDQGRSLITGGRQSPPMLRAIRTFEFIPLSVNCGPAALLTKNGSLTPTLYTERCKHTSSWRSDYSIAKEHLNALANIQNNTGGSSPPKP